HLSPEAAHLSPQGLNADAREQALRLASRWIEPKPRRLCYISSMSTEELLALVLRLPRQERARFVEEVLSSLEEPDAEEVAAAWARELERRSREVADGKVQTVEWGIARKEILSELRERRALRAAS